jgi:hypothetical protein
MRVGFASHDSLRVTQNSRVWCREVARVSHEYHASAARADWRARKRDLRHTITLESHRTAGREFGAEKLPECRTSITRRRNEQVGELARDLRHTITLTVTQGTARVPPKMPGRSGQCSCREVVSVLPISGDFDGVESLVGGRVAPHACKRVHAGRWKPKLAPGTHERTMTGLEA